MSTASLSVRDATFDRFFSTKFFSMDFTPFRAGLMFTKSYSKAETYPYYKKYIIIKKTTQGRLKNHLVINKTSSPNFFAISVREIKSLSPLCRIMPIWLP